MTTRTAVEANATPAREASLPAIRHAGRVLVAAGALGLIGQLLFFEVGLGVNVPIAVVLLLLGGWFLRQRRSAPPKRDAWLAPAAFAFAAFTAFRADPSIVTLDVLTALGLTGAALASFGGRNVLARSFGGVIALLFGALGWLTAGAAAVLGGARKAIPPAGSVLHRAAPAAPVLRGLAIALPVVLVFVALFAAADAVFAEIVDELFGVDLAFGDAMWRLALAAILAWFAAGSLGLAASRPSSEAAEPVNRRWRIGETEVVTVLVAVVAVFMLFVALQAAYLFGGLDTLEATGLTYAEYARRGFFELVVVAMLAGALVVAGEQLTRQRSRRLVVAAAALTVLTGVVLVSAVLRLRLYQEAYGWTELRLYVLGTIAGLAIGLVALLAALATDRVRWIGHALVVTALAVGLVLNVIGPVRFITEQNVARALDQAHVPDDGSSGLDEVYALSLGDDAIPALLRALPVLDEHRYVPEQLGFRLEELRNQEGLNAWQAWNAGRSAARDALEAAEARGDLP